MPPKTNKNKYESLSLKHEFTFYNSYPLPLQTSYIVKNALHNTAMKAVIKQSLKKYIYGQEIKIYKFIDKHLTRKSSCNLGQYLVNN